MRDNKLHTPVGVKDILPEECAIKKEITNKIGEIFLRHCYKEVESPMFEYIEVFSDEKMGSTNPKEMYKFFDRDGSTLALRTDMTPPIARIAATAFGRYEMPLRLSYFGKAFRYNGSYQGKLSEFSQGGIELIGVSSVDADAEVLSIAVKSLLASGLTEFKIHIGQVEFFKAILKETGFSKEKREQLQDMIGNRNYVAIEELITETEIPERTGKLLMELPKLVGTKDVLEKARKYVESKEALDALLQLGELYDALCAAGVEEYVAFNLGMVNKLNYYTGIIFRGYTYGIGSSVVDGGRYDRFVAQYGLDTPAVGFGIKTDGIMAALESQHIKIYKEAPKMLFAYAKAGRATALAIADEYRTGGFNIENSLLGYDFKTNMEYAERRGMSHMLYFTDSINLKLVSLTDEMGGFTVDVTVDELLKPERGEEK